MNIVLFDFVFSYVLPYRDFFIRCVVGIILGFICYFLLRRVIFYGAKSISRLPSHRLVGVWLRESVSDLYRYAKVVSLTSGITVAFSVIYPSFILFGFRLNLAISVVFCCLLFIVFLSVWELSVCTRIRNDREMDVKDRQYTLTLVPLVANSGKYVSYFLGFYFICLIYSIDLLPILAGGGIFLAVLGLAANTLIADILAGWTIFLERLFGVESRIEIISNELKVKGVVTKITWKSTWIQEESGKTVIIANRLLINAIRLVGQDPNE